MNKPAEINENSRRTTLFDAEGDPVSFAPSGAYEGRVSIDTSDYYGDYYAGLDPDELIAAIERAAGREAKRYPTSIQDLWDNAVIVGEIPPGEPAIARFDDGGFGITEDGYGSRRPRYDDIAGGLERRLLFPSPAPEEDPAVEELKAAIEVLWDDDDPKSIAEYLLAEGWKKDAA